MTRFMYPILRRHAGPLDRVCDAGVTRAGSGHRRSGAPGPLPFGAFRCAAGSTIHLPPVRMHDRAQFPTKSHHRTRHVSSPEPPLLAGASACPDPATLGLGPWAGPAVDVPGRDADGRARVRGPFFFRGSRASCEGLARPLQQCGRKRRCRSFLTRKIVCRAIRGNRFAQTHRLC